MQDPKGYQHVSNVQSRDLEVILKEYPFEWKQRSARILDIGCGDGRTTMGLWKKYIPEDYMIIVGSDKSEACVNFAKKNYESERVRFMTLDIEDEVPRELEGCFDHVVSNYTFHWVQQQEKGFLNVYKMLADGGNCLIIFLGKCNIYDNYLKLSRTIKWRADLKDIETKFMSPYHFSKDPGYEIRSLIKKIGFQNVKIQARELTYDYLGGVEEFREMMKCLNPFEGLKDKWEDFMEDYIKLDPNAGTTIYQLLIVSGTK